MRTAAELMTRVFAVVSGLLLPVNQRQTDSGLRLLGSRFLPGDLKDDGTLAGGLSGIDYDPVGRRWVIVTDDRSTNVPARFYTAKIGIAGDRLESFRILGQKTFKRADGTPYPTRGSEERVPDIESVRVDPVTGDVWYITEGDGPAARAYSGGCRAGRSVRAPGATAHYVQPDPRPHSRATPQSGVRGAGILARRIDLGLPRRSDVRGWRAAIDDPSRTPPAHKSGPERECDPPGGVRAGVHAPFGVPFRVGRRE